jgi:hypothetical protein
MGTVSRDDEAMRAHLSSCPECAGSLAREARLELELHEAALASRPDQPVASGRDRATRGRWIALSVASALAFVVAGAWLFRPRVIIPTRTPDDGGPALDVSSTPCLVDPRMLGPGHDVVSPRELCRNITATADFESL